MADVTVPYSDVGKASFEQLDNYLASFLLAGDSPELASYPFAVEKGQTILANTVVGLNSRKKLVPASVSETVKSFVTSAAIHAGGDSGTPGNVTITGVSGTGTKFQATGVIGAGGNLTSINSVTVEGLYTVDPTVVGEAVTGGSLGNCTVDITLEHITTFTNTVQPIGVATQAVTTADGDDLTKIPVWYSGCFNIRALVWDASYVHDDAKFNAFMGSPTPTAITIKQRQSDV